MRFDKNARIAWTLVAVVGGMLGMAYAAVPLYELFCKATGFGGTPIVVQEGERPVLREGEELAPTRGVTRSPCAGGRQRRQAERSPVCHLSPPWRVWSSCASGVSPDISLPPAHRRVGHIPQQAADGTLGCPSQVAGPSAQRQGHS